MVYACSCNVCVLISTWSLLSHRVSWAFSQFIHLEQKPCCLSDCPVIFGGYTPGEPCGLIIRFFFFPITLAPQWGAADAEIKVPSGENTEIKRSPFIAWSRSIYSHTCYAYCQGFLPCLFLPFQSIHLHFFQNLSRFFPVFTLANTGSCLGP